MPRTSGPSAGPRAARAWCQAARASGAAATGSGPIGSAGSSWPDSSRQAPMAAARFCQSSRSSGWAGTGPSAAVAQAGGWLGGVLADPVLAGVHQRGDLGDVGAAFGVGEGGDLLRPRPGRAAGPGCRERFRMRASRTAAMSRDPARSRSAIASARTRAGSRPASSAVRRVRHGHFAWWPGSPAVAGRQGAQEQVAVPLIAGGGGLAAQIACKMPGGRRRPGPGSGSGWRSAAGRHGPAARPAR